MTEKPTLLACYAHPDDEVFVLGGTLAHYGASDTRVALVCATRGDVGQISDPALATPETLPQVREAELRCSAETLGVDELIILGYRDSGMAGTEDNNHPNAFCNAPADEVVPRLVEIIRRLKPQVVLTFESTGGYGHPDHIAIHRHTLAALQAAANLSYRSDLGTPWQVRRLLFPVLARSFFHKMKAGLEAQGIDTSQIKRFQSDEIGYPDEGVHLVVDISAQVEKKWAAFGCHKTQIGPEHFFFRLPEAELKQLISQEHFILATPLPETGKSDWSDLFAGLE